MPLYADIVQISVGETETQWAKNSYRETAETSTDSQLNTLLGKVLLTRLAGQNLLGVVESRGGFLEFEIQIGKR